MRQGSASVFVSFYLFASLFFLVSLQFAFAFQVQVWQFPNKHPIFRLESTTHLSLKAATSNDVPRGPRMGELSDAEDKVYQVMKELHDSKYTFRVVVVGNGAILETTSTLGPVVKISQSPSTGTNLLTLASDDKSFEFHLQLSQTSKMVLTTKETPNKSIRIIRLLNAEGVAMCSLILNDETEAAHKWYEQLQTTFGSEIQL